MKKIMGIALSISMLISALPQTTVWAAGGKCGDNLTWNISNNGTLTINGTGDMYNYHPTGEAPWYNASLNGDVKYIKISQGVESLSDYAFQSSTELKEVMISTTVKQIGLNPFAASNKLQGIYVVPDENPYYCSVGGVLFDKSKTKLIAYPIGKTESSYEIPESVTTIQTGAFDSSVLTSIKIPKSVTTIEEYAFYAANDITDIYYGGTAEDWNKINFDKASNSGISSNNEKLIMHYSDTPKTVSVESISFDSDKLILTKGKSAAINVTFIPSDATNKNITWSSSNNNVAAIENGTVTAVGKGSAVIKAVSEDGNKTAECTVTVTESESGNKCGDNLTWNLDDGTLTVSGTGDMYDYSESNPAPWEDSIGKIKKIILSDGVTSIGNYAFYPYKYSYLTMTVPKSFKKIGNNAFVEVIDDEHRRIFGRLSDINYSGAVEDFKNISIGTGNTGLQYTSTYYNKIKNPVSGFYRNEDSDSNDIKWTLDANGILTVSGNGSMPFEKGGGVYNADGFFDNLVKKIIINEGITGISSFFYLENLEEVTLPSTLKTIENSCFSGDVKLKNILIPDKTEKIGEYVFSGTEIENLTIPKSVKNIGESIVASTPLYDNESNWTDGALYIDNWLIDTKSDLNGEFNVKPGTIGISGGSIKAGISSVTLPQTVKYLSDDAFTHFKGNEISVPYGTIEIGRAFFFSGAKKIYIPKTVTHIDNEAFAYSSTEDIYYEGTEEEWNKLFSSESERKIPEKTTIHFNNTSSGDEEKLYQYEVKDGKAAITAVDKSISGDIIIPSTLGGYPVESILQEAFSDCNNITSIVVPDSVKKITDAMTFTNCKNLEKITLPGEVEFEYATLMWTSSQFAGCDKLKEICISGDSTKYSVEDGVLFSKDGKTLIAYPPGKPDASYTVPSHVEKIGIAAFIWCNNLRALIIPEGVVSIDSMSLLCSNLELFTLPKSAVEFAGFQYWGDEQQVDVYYAGTEEEWYKMFYPSTSDRVHIHFNHINKEITVTTNAQNGQVSSGGKFMFGSLVTLTSAADSGYRFAGWYIGDALVSSESEYSFIARDDVNITAKFNKSSAGGSLSGGYTSKYTVTFVSNGGTDVEAVKAEKNTAVSKPADPTKDGFTFNGWYTDKELTSKYDFSSKLSANLTLYAGWISSDEAQNQIVLTIGKTDASVFGKKRTNDVAPIIRSDRTMLPARFVAESLGAAVKWNEESREVLITGKKPDGSDITIKIYIDSDAAYVNDEKITLDSPAFIENDRTYTPVRFIAEQLGARVEWNESEHKVIITKG